MSNKEYPIRKTLEMISNYEVGGEFNGQDIYIMHGLPGNQKITSKEAQRAILKQLKGVPCVLPTKTKPFQWNSYRKEYDPRDEGDPPSSQFRKYCGKCRMINSGSAGCPMYEAFRAKRFKNQPNNS